MSKIKYSYEVPEVPIISGKMTQINAHIQNITERIKACEPQLKPNVSFIGTEVQEKCNAIFFFQIYDFIQTNTLHDLKKNCMAIIKSILTDARTDIRDKYFHEFEFEFEKDNIDVIYSRGNNSKAYMNYNQNWIITLK